MYPLDPIDGGWSSWMNWSTCSASCNGGYRSRARSCSSPQPALGGQLCDGMPSQTEICNTHGCQGTDSVTLHNYDLNVRTYVSNSDSLTQRVVLPVVGDWGADSWTSWSDCSTSCGSGQRVRTRWCRDQCSDREVETDFRACFKAACPLPGEGLLYLLTLSMNPLYIRSNSTGKNQCSVH